MPTLPKPILLTEEEWAVFDARIQRLKEQHGDGCWLWDGKPHHGKYGTIAFRGKRQFRPHRLSYVRYVGELAPGLFVCHRCDVMMCVNPAHLFAGTPADNARDAAKKGRMATGGRNHAQRPGVRRGERNGHAKLTADDIMAIRASSSSREELAESYGTSPGYIARILSREVWKHI